MSSPPGEPRISSPTASSRSPAAPTPSELGIEYEEQILAGGAPEHRVAHFGKPPLDAALRAHLDLVRAHAGELLDTCLEEIVAAAPAVVGFTVLVHQQTAALALAARVRAALPDACIVFGGAGCRGEMGAELLRSFPFIDAVATGDGDDFSPPWCGGSWQASRSTACPAF